MSNGYTEEWLANRLAKQGAVGRAAVVRDEKIEAGREYRLTVYGEPQPAGSKQAFPLLENPRRICNCGSVPGPAPLRRGNGAICINVTDDNKDTKAWRNQVSKTAREEYSGPLLTGFVSLECIFYLQRPKSHYGTGANEHRIKPSAPAFPGVKPDLDKLMRAVGDGLTQAGNVYTDDSRIVRQRLEKLYGTPRVEITIAEIVVPEPYEQPELFKALAPWETK
jgi:Holliday junction resolvase RusA-like endonuclease